MYKYELVLKRFTRPDRKAGKKNPVPTLGLLFIDGKFFCFTLEPLWNKNKKGSCIPDGKYKLKRYRSLKFGHTLLVQGVKGRTGILFHVGNSAKDTTGCILLGSQVGVYKNQYTVMHSMIVCMSFVSMIPPYNDITLKVETMNTEYGGITL